MDYFDKSHLEKIRMLDSSYLEECKFQRLKYIYNYAEDRFLKNLKRLSKIKYILLGEAPPWSENGEPVYFYSKIESKLHKDVWKAFFDTSIPAEMELAYQKLADKGFLLIDTIPYAMEYSSRLRRKNIYYEIINEYLTFQFSRISGVIYEKELKVVFAFKLNAYAIINAFNGKIEIDNKIYTISRDKIAADGSGYPKPNALKNKFELINSA
jgi:hypothetical protein